MDVSVETIKTVREKCGAGIMECRNALVESGGDVEKAIQCLKTRGYAAAEKKANRVAKQGLVECYIHIGGRIGAMVEVNCETDFVARTQEFKDLAHNLAMQVAATEPKYMQKEDLPAGSDLEPETACLLSQPYIKDPTLTIQDVVKDVIARTGENVKVSRFARFEVGE